MMHEGMIRCMLDCGCVSCYIFVWIFLFTQWCRLIVEKHSLKKKFLFMDVMWQIIRSLERSFTAVC